MGESIVAQSLLLMQTSGPGPGGHGAPELMSITDTRLIGSPPRRSAFTKYHRAACLRVVAAGGADGGALIGGQAGSGGCSNGSGCTHGGGPPPQKQLKMTNAAAGTAAGAAAGLLLKMTTQLVLTYRRCEPGNDEPPKAQPRRILSKPGVGVKNDGADNENCDLILAVQDVLRTSDGSTYTVLGMLGQGTFGQVALCWSSALNRDVAVKVIKNQPAYYHQARVEIGILQLLNARCDAGDRHHIVRMLDFFLYKKHLCLVFEKLDINLFELLKRNSFRGLSLNLLRLFLAQILDSLTVLREASIIHCDLKPENILLKSPQSGELKLIDFGSACFENRTVYSYIQSRFYRSPEVVLGCSYNVAIDMWSLGCVAAELFLGLPLFPGASEHDLLARIVESLGLPPAWLLQEAKHTDKFFEVPAAAAAGAAGEGQQQRGSSSSSGGSSGGSGGAQGYRLLTQAEFEARNNCKAATGKRYFRHTQLADIVSVYPMKSGLTEEEVTRERAGREAFLDFLLGVLDLDPHSRWSPRQAAQHPFITGQLFTGPFQPAPDRQPSMEYLRSPSPAPPGRVLPIPVHRSSHHHAQQQQQQQQLGLSVPTTPPRYGSSLLPSYTAPGSWNSPATHALMGYSPAQQAQHAARGNPQQQQMHIHQSPRFPGVQRGEAGGTVRGANNLAAAARPQLGTSFGGPNAAVMAANVAANAAAAAAGSFNVSPARGAYRYEQPPTGELAHSYPGGTGGMANSSAGFSLLSSSLVGNSLTNSFMLNTLSPAGMQSVAAAAAAAITATRQAQAAQGQQGQGQAGGAANQQQQYQQQPQTQRGLQAHQDWRSTGVSLGATAAISRGLSIQMPHIPTSSNSFNPQSLGASLPQHRTQPQYFSGAAAVAAAATDAHPASGQIHWAAPVQPSYQHQPSQHHHHQPHSHLHQQLQQQQQQQQQQQNQPSSAGTAAAAAGPGASGWSDVEPASRDEEAMSLNLSPADWDPLYTDEQLLDDGPRPAPATAPAAAAAGGNSFTAHHQASDELPPGFGTAAGFGGGGAGEWAGRQGSGGLGLYQSGGLQGDGMQAARELSQTLDPQWSGVNVLPGTSATAGSYGGGTGGWDAYGSQPQQYTGPGNLGTQRGFAAAQQLQRLMPKQQHQPLPSQQLQLLQQQQQQQQQQFLQRYAGLQQLHTMSGPPLGAGGSYGFDPGSSSNSWGVDGMNLGPSGLSDLGPSTGQGGGLGGRTMSWQYTLPGTGASTQQVSNAHK